MTHIEAAGQTEQSFSDIFPIGMQAAASVLKKLDKADNNRAKSFEEEEEILLATNPDAFEFLASMIEDVEDPEAEVNFNIGVSIAHMIFQEKAKPRAIPQLSAEFVQRYDETNSRRLLAIYGHGIESMTQAAEREHYIRLNLFRLMERDFYNELNEFFKDNTGRETALFGGSFLDGVVETYFLFRAGLSDSQNYSYASN